MSRALVLAAALLGSGIARADLPVATSGGMQEEQTFGAAAGLESSGGFVWMQSSQRRTVGSALYVYRWRGFEASGARTWTLLGTPRAGLLGTLGLSADVLTRGGFAAGGGVHGALAGRLATADASLASSLSLQAGASGFWARVDGLSRRTPLAAELAFELRAGPVVPFAAVRFTADVLPRVPNAYRVDAWLGLGWRR